jgi:Phage capsid family
MSELDRIAADARHAKNIAIGLSRADRERKQREDPVALLVRSLIVRHIAHAENSADFLGVAQRVFDVPIEKLGNALCRAIVEPDRVFTKAAVSPAMTTTAGWAAELVQAVTYPGPLAALSPKSAYASLAPRGLRAVLEGVTTSLKLPARTGGSLAGGFFAEGAPIKVAKGSLTATVTLTPAKLAVISTFSDELMARSLPTIEAVIRSGIEEDTRVALDTAFLDTTAASAIRPAGLLNGVTPITATAITGGPLAALAGDVGALAAAVPAAVDFAILMNASERTRAITLAPALADLVVEAPTLAAKEVVALDASDLATAEGDAPRFSVSSEALLHEEDATPLPIGTPGVPAVVAAPSRSLFQTDGLAIRMVQFVTWAMRRSGRVATITNVTW